MSRKRSSVRVAVGALIAALTLPAAATTADAVPARQPVQHRTRPSVGDIGQRLRALPGFTVQEVTAGVPQGFRFFRLTVTQPVDHLDPSKGTFRQRVTILHRDVTRPTGFFTSGYDVSTKPTRSEPTRIIDGNQVSLEHRFFTPSRPGHPHWRSQLTIRQAAADQHRIYTALRRLYTRPWISTGGSKGGMTATYYRYFYPRDMAGTVPYVAPNDVDNRHDVYDRFLSRVGSPTCRADLVAVQRRALGADRAWFVRRLTAGKGAARRTFNLVGSADRAYETAVLEAYFAFWQYQPETACGKVPDARTATREEIREWLEQVSPLTSFSDQEVTKYVPYYYQAARQLGWPDPYEHQVRDVLRYPGADQPASFLPTSLKPVPFDRAAMPAVDRWVRHDATRMLFVYGSLDPWSAEAFSCGSSGRTRDCLEFTVKGGNHGATVQALPEPVRGTVRARIRAWAGLPAGEHPETAMVAGFDQPMVQRRPVR